MPLEMHLGPAAIEGELDWDLVLAGFIHGLHQQAYIRLVGMPAEEVLLDMPTPSLKLVAPSLRGELTFVSLAVMSHGQD